MTKSKVFQSLPCLTEISPHLYGKDLIKSWFKGGDKRHVEKLFYDFISINTDAFNFLQITPLISDSKSNIKLSFRTSNYIGAIPLRSPLNGRKMGDFVVYPRYINHDKNQNDYIQLVYLLKEYIQPEFDFSFELISNDQARPPLFFECVKFIDILFKTTAQNWRKFSSTINIYDFPKGMISWKDYIKNEWNPEKRILFPCKTNILSKNHKDNQHLAYVYRLAKEKIFTSSTPLSLKSKVRKKTSYIDRYFSDIFPLTTNKLIFRNSDPVIIKNLKLQGNKIINYEIQANKAWRIDFSLIFEKYVQHLFQDLCARFGFHHKNNLRLEKQSYRTPRWVLNYFEPDMYIYKENLSVFIDAKYKSHFYNLSSRSDFLVEEHRSDIHQISAYCAFEKSDHKIGFLCYPSNKFYSYKIQYNNKINSASIAIILLGIPITSQNINNIKNNLKREFKNIIR